LATRPVLEVRGAKLGKHFLHCARASVSKVHTSSVALGIAKSHYLKLLRGNRDLLRDKIVRDSR
jgi:hypothetical protein